MTAMQDETVVDAKAVEDRLAAIEDTVCRHPLNREVLYRMLAYCAEERALDDLEREAASWPEFETATQNQYRLAEHLVRAGGLDRIERDERGAIVMEQDKEGLDEDASALDGSLIGLGKAVADEAAWYAGKTDRKSVV